MRNLTKTLAVVSLLAPTSGHSLGIGDIKLHSALNQNLDAEVSLVVSASENASDIKVNLASHEKFDVAGVPWTAFLSNIKFSTVASAKGSVLIKISSKEAVKEPFLDFLLEVSWPKGSLYREFTVLLDPPAVYNPAPPLTESYEPEQAVIPQRQSNPNPQERSLSVVADEYGPTRKNDTLWKIAERAGSQSGVTVEQMMIALYEENPHAFYKENIHALSAGKTLKIPKRDAALNLSRKQALVELNRQTSAWKNRLAPAPVETVSAKKITPDNPLTLVAPTAAEITENAIVAPETEFVTVNKKADEVLPANPNKEVVSVASPADDVLQSKIANLEKQLAMMQQIVALKDQQLAVLQNRSQEKPAAAQTTPGQTEVIKQKPTPAVVSGPVLQSEGVRSSSNTYVLWLGGATMGILSLLGWLWWRKRVADEQTTNPNLFISSNTDNATELKSYASTSIEKNNADAVGASSSLNEFTFGNINTFDTDQDEIDPVSEADVYLAVGRYKQAEELMRDVIKDQPDRDECKLKLLEIFYSTENKIAFAAYANQLAEAGKTDDSEFWGKVTQMGREICQDSALFSAEAAPYSSKNSGINQERESDYQPAKDKERPLSDALTLFADKQADEIKDDDSFDFDLSPLPTHDVAEANETDEHVTAKAIASRTNLKKT